MFFLHNLVGFLLFLVSANSRCEFCKLTKCGMIVVSLSSLEHWSNRGVAGDPGFDHQRLRHPLEEGTPALPAEGAHPPPQAQVRIPVPSTAELLHRAVRGEGPRDGHAGAEGKARLFFTFDMYMCVCIYLRCSLRRCIDRSLVTIHFARS